MFNVQERTMFLCKHGSHAYALNTPESDIDLRGIVVEPIDYVVGIAKSFEQAENVDFSSITGLDKELCKDTTIFGLRKFAKLAMDANPNALEILFVEEEDRYIWKNTAAELLLDNRDLFLSKKAYNCFTGYSRGQFRRLQNHRQWIINPPSPPPTREEYGLPSMPIIPSDQLKAAFAAIEKKLEYWNFSDMSEFDNAQRIAFSEVMAEILSEIQIGADAKWKAAGRILGYDDNFMYLLDKERSHNGLKQHYTQYLNWQKTRNPARYKMEVECRVDLKHASHLIRLYLEVIDILDGKGLILKRPKEERELLMAFKTGKFGKQSYEKLLEWKELLEAKCETSNLNSKLPKQADVPMLDDIVRAIYLSSWRKDGAI